MNIEQFWMVTKLKTYELKKKQEIFKRILKIRRIFRNFKNEKSVNEE